MQADTSWPLADTKYQKLYLDAAKRSLSEQPIAEVATAAFEYNKKNKTSSHLVFDKKFDADTKLIGHMKVKLFLSSERADDADVFVAVQKLNRSGEPVPFFIQSQFEDGAVALGWIRASHRELDLQKSKPYQPVLLHKREIKLSPGEIVPLEIEILPSGTIFRAGETIRLVVQGSDICRWPKPNVMSLHENVLNDGEYKVFTGGEFDSHLMVPVVK